jgi:predicted Ser/Thr protein kinase
MLDKIPQNIYVNSEDKSNLNLSINNVSIELDIYQITYLRNILNDYLEDKVYTRKYTGYTPLRKYNLLTKEQAFDLELEIYKRLDGEANFPKLIGYSAEKLELYLEHCGISFDKLPKTHISNVNEQIDHICDVLNKNNIQHLDMNPQGTNLCYKNNQIYVIDFDIACLDNKPLNDKIQYWIDTHNRTNLHKKITKIIYSNLRKPVAGKNTKSSVDKDR